MKIDGMDICKVMNKSSSCNNCGDYDKWQPCNEIIPTYIPEEQIKKWILTRRSNESKVL